MSDADSTQADTTQKDVWTILRMLQWTTEHLKKHGSGSPRLDAEVLLAHARNCQRIDLYAAYNEEPPESVKAIFRDLVKRRASGEPVAYLTGKKEFYSVPIRVSSDCLIPRPETEHVVVACLDRLKRMRGPVQIVDVCTGSGCIAAAVAKESQRLPEVQVTLTAIDLSPEALAIAKGNFEQLGFGGSIAVQQGDLLASLPDQSYDFILSNPPYISDTEYLQLDKTVRNYEPKMALVSGPTGTEVIERLIQQAAAKLKPGGWLIFEHSPMIAERCLGLLQAAGGWREPHIIKDLAGHPRIAVAERA